MLCAAPKYGHMFCGRLLDGGTTCRLLCQDCKEYYGWERWLCDDCRTEVIAPGTGQARITCLPGQCPALKKTNGLHLHGQGYRQGNPDQRRWWNEYKTKHRENPTPTARFKRFMEICGKEALDKIKLFSEQSGRRKKLMGSSRIKKESTHCQSSPRTQAV